MYSRMKRIVQLMTLLLIGICGVMFTPGGVPNHAVAFSGPTPAATLTPLPDPVQGTFSEASIKNIDLKASPILPDLAPLADHLRAIYQEGQQRGLNPKVFAKVGDCMTASPDYLEPFAKGDYALDKYSALQSVIDYFSEAHVHADLNSFSNPGLAAASGFNAAGVLDATWSDPQWCGADESPLTCAYHVDKPSIAIILFGTNDIKSLTTDQFDYYLRQVVVQTINTGVIPILSTFPNQPGLLDKSLLYNQIVVKIAADYQVPLINLWLAFDKLPDQGINPKEPTHMTLPESGKAASFTEADLQAGQNVHNLLTLQALDALLKIIR
jgi:hypothetical protein